jgi:hypothetical protein
MFNFKKSKISGFRCGVAVAFRCGVAVAFRCGVAVAFRCGVAVVFRCGVAVVFTVVGCFANISGEYVGRIFSVQTFFLDYLIVEDRADRLYRNFYEQLSTCSGYQARSPPMSHLFSDTKLTFSFVASHQTQTVTYLKFGYNL